MSDGKGDLVDRHAQDVADRPVYRRYVALGDSFTEGVGDDDVARPNGLRGWADRVAEQLAAHAVHAGGPAPGYANLAVRGRLLPQILDEQIEPALALQPDLVTVYAGGNDMMRPSLDLDALVARYEAALCRLTASGARVLVFTAYDAGWAPVFRRLRGRTAIYNELLRPAAAQAGADLVDYWNMRGFDDTRMWGTDRLHMSPWGHTLMAAEVLDVLGVPHAVERPQLPPAPALTRSEQRDVDREWLRTFLVPWVGRRLRGASSGDGIRPKYPVLTPIAEPAQNRNAV
ncbi:SGNH/GDSL hydrolase family protein [Tomitella gaofuii]|uniref:SGNH/GDSL hydrolase family protein n=1 Tax=Tomitella gaofuii TaxID=2760083 RepID=UPI0015FA6765|nr:SGNH/GDSL hydrolase family protein [Tomitella gaofuii]